MLLLASSTESSTVMTLSPAARHRALWRPDQYRSARLMLVRTQASSLRSGRLAHCDSVGRRCAVLLLCLRRKSPAAGVPTFENRSPSSSIFHFPTHSMALMAARPSFSCGGHVNGCAPRSLIRSYLATRAMRGSFRLASSSHE